MRRKHDLGLDAFDDNTYDVTRGEMGLLDTLTWFYEQPDLCVAEYCEITPNRVMSFNDPAELEQVIKMLKNFRKRDKELLCFAVEPGVLHYKMVLPLCTESTEFRWTL